MPDKSAYRVCVIGLGSMGMGVARSCLNAGLRTSGIDLAPERRSELLAAGAATVAASAAELPDCGFDAVVVLVVNGQQVRDALFGPNGIAKRLKSGAAVMVSSTQSADDAKAVGRDLAALGLLMLDAPVSGGPAKAAAGEMTVMASGPQAAFIALRPVLDAAASQVYEIGAEIGLGATVKIIHQLLAGVHIAAGAEAMALAARAGIPLGLMYDVVTHAAGNSWMFENRMKHVVDGDYAPKSAVNIFVKDLGLVTETGRALKFPLPLASTAFSMFLSAANAGHGNEDDAAVIKTFAGISLPGQEQG